MKNHVISHFAFLKVFVFLFAALVFVSCSEDDDEENDPTPQDVSYRINLVKIVGITISDAEGDQLEVYGTVNSKLTRDNITEENMISSWEDVDFISVGTSDVPLSSSVTYTVPPENIEASTLEVIASLSEDDSAAGNDDEFLGTKSICVPLSDISESVTYQMVFDESPEQVVQLTYSITRE